MQSLLLSTLILSGVSLANTVPARAQEAASAVSFSVPAGPLSQALVIWVRQAGIQISYLDAVISGKSTAGVSGSLAPQQALARLLTGTGLRYTFSGGHSVLISGLADASGAAADNVVVLDPVVIGGRGSAFWDGDPAATFDVTANVDSITAREVETYQIATPSDILRNTTGVLSGDARNSGSLNANIHGLQGQGRVPVTVDGAENTSTVYRGYQGIADRSFIDPDFISSVAIEKGASTSRPGIGGAVSVRTLSAADVVRPGHNSGFRLKFSAIGNTSQSEIGTRPDSGASRPSLLTPTGGSASLSYAYIGDKFEVVAGISERDTGNYHAGTNGKTHGWIYHQSGNGWYGALSPVGHGQEAMNTSNASRSVFGEVTYKFSDDLKWQLGYSQFDTEFGEIMPSRYTSVGGADQWKFSETTLETVTSRLRWNPESSDLIDLSWNIRRTTLNTESVPVFAFSPSYPANKDISYGTDLSNRALFETAWGDIAWTVGASFKSEKARQVSDDAFGITTREGRRREIAAFSVAEWAVNDRLTFNGGLRYTGSESTPQGVYAAPSVSDTTFDKSFGVSYEISDSATLYANYRSASRLPSLYETLTQSMFSFNPPIEPERAKNIDLGVNFSGTDVFGADTLNLKLSYFDSDVSNYIAMNVGRFSPTQYSMHFVNIDRARFKGFDLSSKYVRNGFTATFGATYYDEVEFCYLGQCGDNTLGTDYAKNQVPPKLQLSLDVSQKLMDERLTLGGRVTHYGERATDPGTTLTMSSLVAPVPWTPVTLVDLYAHFDLNECTRLSLDVQNVSDQYYIEPMSLAPTPGPGRSARLMLDYRF